MLGSKSDDTDAPVWMHEIASASSLPTDTWRILVHERSTSAESGIVFETTTSSTGDASIA